MTSVPPSLPPEEIERRSFAIIGEELAGTVLDPKLEPIIKRVIHTTADFDYARNLVFSGTAVEAGLTALRGGSVVVTDTRMAMAGINKRACEAHGCEVHCLIGDADVAESARRGNVTRARAAVDKAAGKWGDAVYVVGNAPTALIRIHELIRTGALRPSLVVGAPVGFVNVVESKELLLRTDVPHIVARGRKGGSNVAAAIVNALLYMA